MASAVLKNDKNAKQIQWANDGEAIGLAIALARLSRKEAAGLVGMEESQLSAQIAGHERPQTERFESVKGSSVEAKRLRVTMAVAKALQRPDCFTVNYQILAAVTA